MTQLARPGLTSVQRVILDFIRHHISGSGYPPSVREVAKHAGLRSTSSVVYQLEQLEAKGYIRRHGARSRAIVICSPEAA